MQPEHQSTTSRLTVIQRSAVFLLLALVALGFVMGWVITSSLERSMVSSARQMLADIVSEEVQKEFVAAELIDPKMGPEYDDFTEKIEHLTFGPNIVRISLWNKDDVVVWSNEEKLVGSPFPANEELNQALNGEVAATISGLDKAEHQFDGGFTKLLELYVPIRFDAQGDIDAVFEVYQNVDPLYRDISQHKRVVWDAIAVGLALLYLVVLAEYLFERRRNGKRTSRE